VKDLRFRHCVQLHTNTSHPTHFIDTGNPHLQKISQVAPRVRVVRNVAGVYVYVYITRVYVTRVYVIRVYVTRGMLFVCMLHVWCTLSRD
jgi:hypothetical protein